MSFASAEYAGKKCPKRRERFSAEMKPVVPWGRLEALIEPHYPRSGKVGGPPIGGSFWFRPDGLDRPTTPYYAKDRGWSAGQRRADGPEGAGGAIDGVVADDLGECSSCNCLRQVEQPLGT